LQARQLGGHSSEFLGSGVLLNSQVNGSRQNMYGLQICYCCMS
jgi:hypothetical protein